jgi:hypothetical protein
MLKLEKTSREGIHIILRDKDRALTKPLWIAFSIACAIHLTLLLLFYITPFTYDAHQTVFPPIRAEAASETAESAVADIKPVTPSIRGLPNPRPSRPYPSDTPHFVMNRPLEHLTTPSSRSTNFNELETDIYEPTFQPLVKETPKPFFILVSGSLAEQTLQTDSLKERALPFVTVPTCLVYNVIVEGKTGTVFWFEPVQETNLTLTNFAEKILRELTFDLDSTLAVVSGQIELHFNPGDL